MAQTYFMSLISLYRFTTLPEIFRNSYILFYAMTLLKRHIFYIGISSHPLSLLE